jgi:succinate-acetate transporter protein
MLTVFASPIFFFPFVMLWGGLAQFIAGLYGFHARDTLVTVFHTLWGSFWLAAGILWLMTAAGAVPLHSLRTHFPELASWAVVLMVFTWICAIVRLALVLYVRMALMSRRVHSLATWSSSASSPPPPSAAPSASVAGTRTEGVPRPPSKRYVDGVDHTRSR